MESTREYVSSTSESSSALIRTGFITKEELPRIAEIAHANGNYLILLLSIAANNAFNNPFQYFMKLFKDFIYIHQVSRINFEIYKGMLDKFICYFEISQFF